MTVLNRLLSFVGNRSIIAVAIGLMFASQAFAGPPSIAGVTWTSYNFTSSIIVNGTPCTVGVTAWNAGATSDVTCDWYIGALCFSCEVDDTDLCEALEKIYADMAINNPQNDQVAPPCNIPAYDVFMTTRIRFPSCWDEGSVADCYEDCGSDKRCEYFFKTCSVLGARHNFGETSTAINPNDGCDAGCIECDCF